ncbi:MAG: GNAT family N-acetyltransferase [Hyphomicrobiaceae bacterium]
MAFLRSSTPEPSRLLYGRGLYLRAPRPGDYAAWADLRERSRAHLTPWEPSWARDELSRTAFRRRLRLYERDTLEDLGYAFFIFQDSNDGLLGGLTLSNVRRGVTQAGTLGYWVGAPFAGKGCMTEAVRVVVPFVFDELRLHRLEAACLPNNMASTRVLERNGFQREGFARRYLKIDGAWRDHVLYALLEEDVYAREAPHS